MSNAAQNGAQGIQLRNIISTIFLIPFGKWIVCLIGVIVLAVSMFQGYRGLRSKFDQQINGHSLNYKKTKIIKIVGRVGTLARAVVSSLIGLFLLFAAYHSNSAEVKGIDGALLSLLRQPYGSWLLGFVAIGLIAFGVYSLLIGFWFKFKR